MVGPANCLGRVKNFLCVGPHAREALAKMKGRERTAGTARILYGGEAGIRTLVTVTRKTAFEAAAFNHSATSPHREAKCSKWGAREANCEE